MWHKYFKLQPLFHNWRYIFSEEVIALLLVVLVFAAPPSSAMRLRDRSLYMNSVEPSAVTDYTVSFRYMSPLAAIGSVDMLFCIDPIPYHPCAIPPGLDVSSATLTEQNGESGFGISTQSTNHIVLSRTPGVVTNHASSYKLSGIVNPADTSKSFSVRLRTHASTDASGTQIDFGSVKGQVTDAIIIETQVPPMLIFCVAQQVDESCASTNEVYYSDMGELSPDSTLAAQSEMAVGTNASAGFSIFTSGNTMSAGTSTINPLQVPTPSVAGTNQFGINLVSNSEPLLGADPQGPWTNAVAAPDYAVPNRFKFLDGDEVAYSPNVSLMRKFTVSYIVNSSDDLRAGVYTTTVNFIASGRF